MADERREQVRKRYAQAAAEASACCGNARVVVGEPGRFGLSRYDAIDLMDLPVQARQASLGCGNPLLVAGLHAGERVLDLGSGGGLDVLAAARRVGPDGFVHGLDMTTEMLELATANAAADGATNVAFHEGIIEDIPLPDASVDVVISNCVINLSTDKPAVLAQMFRVLAPGGRIAVSDVVAEDWLSPAEREQRGSYVGCVAGAMSRSEYLTGLSAVGFADADVAFEQEVADGLHSARITARKPESQP